MKKHLLLLLTFFFSITIYGQHLKKDGTPDRRYKENKSYYSAPKYSAPRGKSTYKSARTYRSNRSSYSYGIQRDSRGRIKRSSSARREFMKTTGYPQGRKGYVVDHIVPLKKGGCDCPENMQWQTKEAAKEKDKWERP
jgi:hypothetical protein